VSGSGRQDALRLPGSTGLERSGTHVPVAPTLTVVRYSLARRRGRWPPS